MKPVDKLKAAAAELNPDDQFELFRWWIESDGFKSRQLASLKRDIAVGILDLEAGRYQSYDDANVMLLSDQVRRRN